MHGKFKVAKVSRNCSHLRKEKLQTNDHESHMAVILNVFDRLILRGHFQ